MSSAEADADRLRSIILRARSALETAPVKVVAEILAELEHPPGRVGDDAYRIALRPHHEIEGAEDDIVVKDVEMFRMEQMDRRVWWACCYFPGTEERIAWDIRWDYKLREVVVRTTEQPEGFVYEEDLRPEINEQRRG